MNRTTTFRVCALICISIILAGCDREPIPVPTSTYTGPTMGTTYHVTVVGLQQGGAGERSVRRCIDDVLAQVERHLSTYSASSEITAFNANPSTDWIPVSDPLFAVIAAAQRVSAESDGAFDLTIAPIVRLWGFGRGGSADAAPELPPSPEFVYDATAVIGYTWLELRSVPRRAVRKGRTPLELDVDGIAPGYAVDRISGCLTRARWPRHLVEIGGEVRAAGRRDDGRPWRVAIERPLAGARQVHAGIDLSDLAASTSGNYRDFRRLPDGQTVSHTIDPRTGAPVRHALASVTVVHARTELADAYATALMVLGPEEGLALAQRLGLPAMFLERIGESTQFRERSTPEFETLRSAPET